MAGWASPSVPCGMRSVAGFRIGLYVTSIVCPLDSEVYLWVWSGGLPPSFSVVRFVVYVQYACLQYM